MRYDYTLDTRGQTCPLPVISLKRIMRDCGDNIIVRVVCSDKEVLQDILSYLDKCGLKLLNSNTCYDEKIAYVKKK
ncbi:MAG: sulfurtransferase TusA family protein [gamma proteobacterium symbiont of Lucinoma myriamae]|nr:sulfurtransferase TusA family protein [gamma proteobacterium symbiont of Lucinoma myriamae]MCU7819738.1 sulfurtransferase TusA family protein [gamma proteobacterium symbiont of Lucinoma myriamae]MCU7832141.1 sulfurtransferase TusA family protein [gamma proteobacterium symbiont of Lucinoma myriamae]